MIPTIRLDEENFQEIFETARKRIPLLYPEWTNFNENDSGCDSYRPLFWYKDSDKRDYENAYDVKHSACYREYGLKRTGCAGCPFGRAFEQELEIISKYEPKLYQAVNYIFKDSYEYTKMYWEFRNKEEMVQVA